MTTAGRRGLQPVWASRVVCGHRAILGQLRRVASWRSDDGCAASAPGGWQIGVSAAFPVDVGAVLAAVAAVRDAAASRASADHPHHDVTPVASVLARVVAQSQLPDCSILLSDGDQLAALSWGRPLGIVELGGWEYAVTSSPPPDLPGVVSGELSWVPLRTGTVAALDPCGPTIVPLRPPTL